MDKIDAKRNEGTAHIAAAARAIARFRQALLTAACSGALTADFRDANAREDEAARLEAILKERYRQWQLASRDRSSRIRYRDPLPATDSDLEIPQTWSVTSLSHLAHLDVGHAFRSAEYAESGVRLLRGENSSPGRLKWNDVRYWPSDRVDEFKHLLVREDDLILGMDRPIVSAGLKLARVTSQDVPSLLVQRVLRIRSVEPQASRFVEMCLQQGRFERFLGHDGMTGTDLPHITGEGVARFPIPLPPLAEEVEIVRRVDRLFALADPLVRRIDAASQHLDRSSRAVLAKIFRGDLTSEPGVSM